MKKIFLCLVLLVVSATGGQAETRYVSGVLQITLRTGPGVDHRVLTMIKTGQEVAVLDAGDKDWTKIRLSDGREGWVMNRFLVSEKPGDLSLEYAQQKNRAISLQLSETLEANSRLRQEADRMRADFADIQKKLDEIEHAYRMLERNASQSSKIKADFEKSASDLAIQARRSQKMEQALRDLRRQQHIKWFLSGAGVLLAGFLLGLSVKRQRRKTALR